MGERVKLICVRKGAGPLGMRFRKSVKIAPGLRLNVGKKSVGVSIGGKGFRHSINSSGRKTTTVGLPGTGISYSHNLRKSLNRTVRSNQIASLNQLPSSMDIIDEYMANIVKITRIHNEIITVPLWEIQKNEVAPFETNSIGPEENQVRNKIENYKPSLIDKVFNLKKRKVDRMQFEVKQAILKDADSYQVWVDRTEKAKKYYLCEPRHYQEVLLTTGAFKSIEQLGCSVYVTTDQLEEKLRITLFVDQGLIPLESAELTKAGRLTQKKLTKTSFYSLYQQYVCSLVLKVVRDCFMVIPHLGGVELEVKEHGIDKMSEEALNHEVLSVFIHRDSYHKLQYDKLNPVYTLERLGAKQRFLKTKGYQTIS